MNSDTLFFIFKALISGLLIAGISSLAKTTPRLAALLTALPLMTVLSLIWIYLEQKDLKVLENYTKEVFLYVLPTLVFFAAAFYLFKIKTPFWPALLIALLILFLSVALFKKLGFLNTNSQTSEALMNTSQEGQTAPDFTAKDEAGNTVQLSQFKGKNVILYFYPKDDTPGCTTEACNFRDNLNQFQNAETQILGVSFDDAASHVAFKEKFHLNFPLLVDSDKKIAQAYGVGGMMYADRDTIVIDKEGKIKKILRKVDPKTHSQELLQLLR